MLSIIIPAMKLRKGVNPRFFYKKRFHLTDTIESIAANVACEKELILVVNGQDDSDLVEFARTSPAVTRYALLSANVGVARAWNVGAHLALGDVLCFCNDDVHIGKDALETLMKVLADPTVGEVGPAGGEWRNGQPGAMVGLEKIEEAEQISGFLFLTRTSVFEEVGGFDNAYTPAGVEEIDFSFKVRARGYRCVVVPGLDAVHYGSHGISSTDTTIHAMGSSITTGDLDRRNKQYFRGKWIGSPLWRE